jgi:hypothetical protein
MYESRGDQITLYGFTAFGLTVAPYVWMSFVNLCANLMCPDYSSMYLVGSEAMTKLQDDLQGEHQPLFDGVVGRLTRSSDSEMVASIARIAQARIGGRRQPLWMRSKHFVYLVVLTVLAAVVPIAIIGSISRFQLGSRSTIAQIISVTLWLLYGFYFGVISPLILRSFEERPILNTWAASRRSKKARLIVVLTFLLGFNAIFGFIHVGEMMVAYGVCIYVG